MIFSPIRPRWHCLEKLALEGTNLTSWMCIYRENFDLIVAPIHNFDFYARNIKMKRRSKRKVSENQIRSRGQRREKITLFFPNSTTGMRFQTISGAQNFRFVTREKNKSLPDLKSIDHR